MTTPTEKRIVNVLYYANKPLSTSDIAKRSKLSWVTAKKYLVRLYGKKLLRRKTKGKSVYWWLRT
ncbi:MAG: hypothetical protein LAKADJCE_00842 [Candidatus Argoarchaeum ethanivorans]|uniref:HTH arsR-type domain-containing protein n=1 Tax=Candidatus Argoarchaeum ethanivorans TaxID=2608793 RepID=A0A811TFT4_9EURY|nr:MAG: hypothetical protein LAKADJCE_00842 [Candidatus Argoarchaeum ethanivorans]